MQNKAKVKYAKININTFVTMRYDKIDLWLFRQNKPNKAKNKPNLTQFKPKTKPIGAKRKSSACLREQTQFKPNLTYGEFGVLKYRNFYSILKNVISIRNEKLNIFYLTHSKEAL